MVEDIGTSICAKKTPDLDTLRNCLENIPYTTTITTNMRPVEPIIQDGDKTLLRAPYPKFASDINPPARTK